MCDVMSTRDRQRALGTQGTKVKRERTSRVCLHIFAHKSWVLQEQVGVGPLGMKAQMRLSCKYTELGCPGMRSPFLQQWDFS